MGVHGLWQLLAPAGKPVSLERLEGLTLAVDISIWVTSFIKVLLILYTLGALCISLYGSELNSVMTVMYYFM